MHNGKFQQHMLTGYISIYLWLYRPLLGLGGFFTFLISYTVYRTPWTRDQPGHRTAQTQNKRTQTPMPQVAFEPTIPVIQRAKTVHAPLLRSAYGIKGKSIYGPV
jgi:hypothetical protein